jgi:glutamate racemase
MDDRPIGIFDSGVGGLSILREVRRLLPSENLIYFADQINVPYGQRGLREVREFSEGIARFLLARGAKIIVVACNTASAASLHHLREVFPRVPFVGMEPAVKPAAELSRKRTIGVIATEATFQGALFASVVDRFAGGVRVLTQTCAGLVEQIEKGEVQSAETRRMLETCLEPLLREEIDSLVLACTHYPFATPAIREIVGPDVTIVDPSPAVARQVRRVLAERSLLGRLEGVSRVDYATTGAPERLRCMVGALFGDRIDVDRVRWVRGRLTAAKKELAPPSAAMP